jgi:hypothetical protein
MQVFMDEDKVFEDEMELLELSFKSAKPQKAKNDWDYAGAGYRHDDRWDDDDKFWSEYMRNRKLEALKEEDDLNERR